MKPRTRVLQAAVAGLIATAAWPVFSAAGQCDFQQVFTRQDENGTATVTVYQAKAVTLPNGKRPLLNMIDFPRNGRRIPNSVGTGPIHK